MVVSSTLVNVAEDAELRLVSLLSEKAASSDFAATCEACIASEDAAKLIQTIVSDASALSALVQHESSEEAVGAFSILVALLDSSTQSLTSILDAIVQQDGDSSRKLALISVLYNMRADSQEKCTILSRMFPLASPGDLAEDQTLGRLLVEESTGLLTNPSIPRIVAMLDSWNVSDSSRRHLYRLIAESMSGTSKQRFLLLLVATYQNQSVDADGLKVAKEVSIGAIRDPISLFTQQRNLMTQPAVQALAKTEPILSGLLQVFQEGRLTDYQQYLQNNGGEDKVLKPFDLDVAASERYMKILSLCSLAAEHEEIPYETVVDTLQTELGQVESWVIAAVGSGLLEAKMDQLVQKVMVERCVVRQFDMNQWKVLQNRLQAWKKNVGGVLDSLKQSQTIAAKPK
jgi:translation initiation factor 3 subunit M